MTNKLDGYNPKNTVERDVRMDVLLAMICVE